MTGSWQSMMVSVKTTACTTCGKRPIIFWGLCVVAGLAMVYVLCRACKDRDPLLHQGDAFLLGAV